MKGVSMVRATVLALVTIAAVDPIVSTVGAQSTEAVAIVVHPDVDVDNLPFDQLRSIFLAERQYWNDRSRITLLVRAAIAPERDAGPEPDLWHKRGPVPAVLDRQDVSKRGDVEAQDRVQHRHAQ